MRQHYKHYSDNEKNRLIMECRQSGLSDYQWCCQNGINSSTFYNWIKKLRDVACEEVLILSESSHHDTSVRQDVVKVNILPKDEPTSVINQSRPTTDNESVSMEVNLDGCIIKVYNNANPELLGYTINLLRGVL